jgi:hypothetical protein
MYLIINKSKFAIEPVGDKNNLMIKTMRHVRLCKELRLIQVNYSEKCETVVVCARVTPSAGRRAVV